MHFLIFLEKEQELRKKNSISIFEITLWKLYKDKHSFFWKSLLKFNIFSKEIECFCFYVSRFADDIEMMTGNRPGLYWLICWKYLSPLAMLSILFASFVEIFVKGSGYAAWVPSKGTTEWLNWPTWSLVLISVLILASILWIPVVAICRSVLWRPLLPFLPFHVKKLLQIWSENVLKMLRAILVQSKIKYHSETWENVTWRSLKFSKVSSRETGTKKDLKNHENFQY